MSERDLSPGLVIIGPLFSEPMRIETVAKNANDTWSLGLVGAQTEKFRRVTLSATELSEMTIFDSAPSFEANSQLLRLAIQAHCLGIAYEFDPYFGLSISRVDPLPHQLEAVYDYLLKLPRVRFLLADDAGAGKTIMSGLLIRELQLRGLIERILIVCPSNLAFQWQRELKDKFDEHFTVIRGGDVREQYGVNQWLKEKKTITSLDLAKRTEILPGLKQVQWDLVIVDEAHRMSWTPPSKKTARYALGELLRDCSDHIVLLTATPHKGSPANFTLFLQLLDEDVYADVRSIQEAMQRQRAPFYLRRTKEAMVYFPERQTDGSWIARKIFTKRIPHTVNFEIDGSEFDLYQDVTRFVKRQCARAIAQGDDARARAVGFLMSMYQRRLASSTHSMRCSLENRVRRLEDMLRRAHDLIRTAPPELPDQDDLEEMEESEREKLENILDAITLANNSDQVREEIDELKELAKDARAVEDGGHEAKLAKLKELLHQEGFFDRPDQRLLIFTEFKDTLFYLQERFQAWGFTVGCIHGSMKPGSRDEPGTRLYSEQQFKEGNIQILLATEAAGEGINLQVCNILFNYDIPWNPNRLEQRMGRIHRYGQHKDCLIFNFVADNTIEGRVLQKLLDKLQEIRDALEDDAVFNVVGEILPASHIERILRDYYAGKMGDADLEERLLHPVDENRFRSICQNALEGLATKKLNLEMLIERRARAQERRVVPETIARFLKDAADFVPFKLKTIENMPHTFEPARTPPNLKLFERDPDWKYPELANKYPRCSTDRITAESNNLEWVTPGHPLFEAIRRHTLKSGQECFAQGACFYSLKHETPSRMDFYRARIVDGLGQIIHEKLFAVEIQEDGSSALREPGMIGDFLPGQVSSPLPQVVSMPEPLDWLHENVLQAFLDETRSDRLHEIECVADHVELSLTELMQRVDDEIGKVSEDVAKGIPGAEGRLAQAENRHAELLSRRERRRRELTQQRALTLQAVERLTSVLILPHPDRQIPEARQMRANLETEATAMQVVMDYEQSQGRQVYDIHEKNLGYDITSLDINSGELRLIEVKGLAAPAGTILLTPNERRVAEDRRDCYWLYVVTNCANQPTLKKTIKDPAQFPWHEVSTIQHYWLNTGDLS